MDNLPDHIKKDCITNDDGYKVFWPIGNNGYYGPYDLRQIADYLDKENEAWDAIVQKDLAYIAERDKNG